MAIVLHTVQPRTTRTCDGCGEAKGAHEFAMTRDAAGKHARSALCNHCAPTPEPSSVAESFPLGELIPCSACKKGYPQHRYEVNPETGARRKNCDICRNRVDELLRARVPVESIVQQTRISRSTITSRRRDLGLPDAHERMTATQKAAAIALARNVEGDVDVEAIAAEVGAKPLNVRRMLRREGLIETQENLGPVDPQLLAWARRLLAGSTPYREVARTTGIGIKTLIRHFPDQGADRDNRSMIAWINLNPDIRKLYEELNKGLPAVT